LSAPKSEIASSDQWTLIRNARQLLTLQGASGPRRGPALSQLGIVAGGVILIRNGLIEEVGPARRVENLAGSRHAREIDAAGKIVMPAFCDPDRALIAPEHIEGDSPSAAGDFRKTSRKRVLGLATNSVYECVRYGCLTVGGHSGVAGDLKSVLKLLRTHRSIQSKPLRIRSILSLRITSDDGGSDADLLNLLADVWMPSVHRDNLASVAEFTLGGPHPDEDLPLVRRAAVAAATQGFTLRLRSLDIPEPALLQLALASGAMAIVAPPDSLRAFAGPLAALGCVRVIPVSAAFDQPDQTAVDLRNTINEGSAVALASGSLSRRQFSTANIQFILHLAVERLGLTPEEAIMAVSYNAACSLRMSRVTGSLEPGKSADILIMDVPDYRDLARRAGHHDLSLVLHAGRVIWRAAPLILD
jgi:imidazolonepropionase